jgi:hypothetical protein
MHPGVAIRADDTRDWGLETPGPGLLLDVPRTGRWALRPALHLEAAPHYRLRLMHGARPVLWACIDPYWDRAIFVRGSGPGPRLLPLLSAPEVRAVSAPPGTEGWWEAWAWRFARALVDAPESTLHSGSWCLRPVRAIDAEAAERHPVSTMEWRFGQPAQPPHSLDAVPRFREAWTEDWWESTPAQRPGAVLALRAPSASDDGRVKSWRKHARAGTLPPVVLSYVDILAKWLVLDGHDRLHAALLEGVTPPLLGLWPFITQQGTAQAVREQGALFGAEFQLKAGETPEVIERVNRMLLLNFTPPPKGTVTRAWPIPGGRAAWHQDLVGRGREIASPSVDGIDWEALTDPHG